MMFFRVGLVLVAITQYHVCLASEKKVRRHRSAKAANSTKSSRADYGKVERLKDGFNRSADPSANQTVNPYVFSNSELERIFSNF